MEIATLNKKGQTLVEVVVAFGILVLVFAGVVSLIMKVAGRIVSTRSQTEAIALSQKGLAEGVSSIGNSCSATIIPAEGVTIFPVDKNGDGNFDQAGETLEGCTAPKTCTVKVVNPTTVSGDSSFDTVESTLVEVISTVDWDDPNLGAKSYQLRQVVSK